MNAQYLLMTDKNLQYYAILMPELCPIIEACTMAHHLHTLTISLLNGTVFDIFPISQTIFFHYTLQPELSPLVTVTVHDVYI